MSNKEIALDSVRAMLNSRTSDQPCTETVKEEAVRLKLEAQRRRVATELHAVSNIKASYINPSWRKKKT